jgi:hypothetical protein
MPTLPYLLVIEEKITDLQTEIKRPMFTSFHEVDIMGIQHERRFSKWQHILQGAKRGKT